MKITLNNRPETINEHAELTINELLTLKNFSYKMLMVRINNETIKQDQYSSTTIKDGDDVAIIHLMTGG